MSYKFAKHWYFKIINEHNNPEIVSYGDETQYTQKQAAELLKEECKKRGWLFIRVADHNEI